MIRRRRKIFRPTKFHGKFKSSATQTDHGGEVHYHLRSLTENPALAAAVRAQYAQPALVPASPWIAAPPVLKPKLTVDTGKVPRMSAGKIPVSNPARGCFNPARTESGRRKFFPPAGGLLFE